MLKCNKGERTAELEEALATVLDIIKSVNDSMHQIAITGFEVSSLIRQVVTSGTDPQVEGRKVCTKAETRMSRSWRVAFSVANILTAMF